MYFEQALVGDHEYFHQDRDGWKAWCDSHFDKIKRGFYEDLDGMSREDQRYFGDWANYFGYGDVGYYLGCRFVHFFLLNYEFDEMIRLDVDKICKLFEQWHRKTA